MSRHTPAADKWITTMDLFAGLTPRQLRQVTALGTLLHKAPGVVLAREGHLARELVVVVSGTAVATVGGQVVADLDAGSQLGATVLRQPARQPATVTTVTPTDVVVFSAADIRHLVHQLPLVGARLEEAAAGQVRSPARSGSSSSPSGRRLPRSLSSTSWSTTA